MTLGQSLQMREDPLGFLMQLSTAHAADGLAPLQLGSVKGYLVFAPELVEEVLRSSMRSFNRQTPVYRTLSRFLGQGILTAEGDHWRRHRRIVQPSFHKRRLQSFATTIVDCTDAAIDGWGEEIDLSDAFMRLTLEVVGRTLFGTDMRWMAAELAPALDDAQRHAERVIAGLVPPDEEKRNRADGGSRRQRRFDRAVETLSRLAYELIDRRRARNEAGDDVLGMLLASRDDQGAPLPRQQLRDEVLTLISAGHETTANALSWTLIELGRHGEVWEQLVCDVDRTLGSRRPSDSDVPAVAIARRILDESLRLHPPVWTMGRIVETPVVIAAREMRAGDLALLSPWVTHRRPELWPSPDAFRPQRWEETSSERHPFAFFPFGGGARKCVGEAFAYLEATLVLLRLAQRVRLEVVEDKRLMPEPQLTLGIRGSAVARVHRRHPNRALGP